ncbi:MAG: hypothetical protein LBF27_18865 [Sphingobacterium sp.]|nr:hypothetical protein [Sphingobacterium sp.]
MKNLFSYLIVGSLLFTIYSCQKEDKPIRLTREDSPKIFYNWAKAIDVQVGQKLEISPVVSPADGAKFSWTLDDEIIAVEKDLNYTVNKPKGSYMLTFRVERYDQSTSRSATMNVK